MPLSFPLVSDSHKQHVIRILRDLGGIFFPLDLVYGGFNGLVVFQLDNNGGGIDILARDEDKVGEAFAGG